MNFRDLLRTMRPGNLLIIVATQMFCWFCLINPMASFIEGNSLFLNFGNALLLSIATALLAAAGYIINDYFDVKIDAINRPKKSLIGKDINPKSAIVLHNFCNILGLFIFSYLSKKLGNYNSLFIPIICSILLWFYSTHFKRQFVIGNVVVSILTALSLLIMIAYEPAVWTMLHKPFLQLPNGQVKLNPTWILMCYSGFAFLLNWIREIIKDLEDFKGDAENGCVTMPIKIGIQKTLSFVQFLVAITLLLLLIASIITFSKSWIIPGLYLVIALCIPLFLVLFNINKSASQTHFALYSKRLKIIMVLGIFSLVVFYIFQYYNLQK